MEITIRKLIHLLIVLQTSSLSKFGRQPEEWIAGTGMSTEAQRRDSSSFKRELLMKEHQLLLLIFHRAALWFYSTAVCETTPQLLSAGLAPAKVIFFIDSQAAILALSSNTPNDCPNTIQYQTKIVELIPYGWTVALQWVPSHVGTLTTVDPIPKHLERGEAFAQFCLTTGPDFLEVYLHWLGVVANVASPIFSPARMDGDHLLQCTGFDKYPTDDIVSQYW
ncbi:reverse transcriptase [Trichonephila clavipes]|nr:reverse transcriptase [Trichonephila clavipes]